MGLVPSDISTLRRRRGIINKDAASRVMGETTLEKLAADDDGIARAAALLAQGALVAVPTETVYGLGADARNPDAVAGIYAAKGRPAKNPLIVHVASLEDAASLIELPHAGRVLAEAFWPGPLTLVAPARDGSGIAPAVRAGHDTLAVRVPEHPVAQVLLRQSGCALAAPSANRSGHVSPTTAEHVIAELDGRIAAVVDGGPARVGVESTIVDVSDAPALLRPGGVPLSVLEACLGAKLLKPAANEDAPQAHGQLSSHYAPRAHLRLNANSARPGEVLLGFGPVANAKMNLSPSADLVEAAANLFRCLRELDDAGPARRGNPGKRLADGGCGRGDRVFRRQ